MTSLDPSPPLSFDDEPRRPPHRTTLALGTIAILALLGAWLYVFFIYDPGLLIDELADRDFPEAAEQICADAMADLEALPPAAAATSPAERAAVVERSNVILADMADQLDPIVPEEPARVRRGVQEWIGDWRTYIGDRQTYAESLREDPDARFLESPKNNTNRGITPGIDSFAQVNEMLSCLTPDDVS